MKIAIIGTGISGLGAAYLLHPHHDITVYEKNAYIGGHSRTIDVTARGKTAPVDTGFIVFNNWNYPNLMGLFERLGVPYQKSEMSFGVSIADGWLEYSSGGLFAQARNFIRPSYWRMLADIVRFNKQAPRYLDRDPTITLGQCLDELRMGAWFRDYYLLAMGAAIWSCPVDMILDFPARTYVQFFKNHGLLNIKNRPQWYTVTGGSREYVERLTAPFRDKIKLSAGVKRVEARGDQYAVIDNKGDEILYDQVIFACHADEALAMIDKPTEAERAIIGSFSYQPNSIIVHRDMSFMPQRKKCWASWVYLSEERKDDKAVVSLSYWMNNLQGIDTQHPVIVTLNPGRRPQEILIYNEHKFSHPIFNTQAIQAQERLAEIQGQRGLWFCGAYQRYGFHEDGLLSAVNVAKSLGVPIPWH